MDPCSECGYDYDAVARDAIPATLHDLGVRYATRLVELGDDVLRAHPNPAAWSALEYACHVRDVFRVQRERVRLAIDEDQPSFVSMRREERAQEEQYNLQKPAVVATELAEAADTLGGTFAGLSTLEWARTGIYQWPERRVRTVEWIGRHTIHEAQHHLLDIEQLILLDHS